MFGGRVNERRVPRLKLDHLCQELRSTGGLLAEGADPSFFSHRISSATTAKTSFFHPVGAQIFPTPMADHPPPLRFKALYSFRLVSGGLKRAVSDHIKCTRQWIIDGRGKSRGRGRPVAYLMGAM